MARVIKQIVLKLESIQSVPLKMNDPFGTLLASFWCDIVEAYKGAMNFSRNDSFICEKKTMMPNFLTSWLEFENKQVKTA